MGRNNMQLWTLYNIHAHRISKRGPDPSSLYKPVNQQLHVDYFYYMNFRALKDPVYFVADSTHLFKSLRNMMLTNDFRFPAWAIRNWEIEGGDVVKWEHISQLYELEKNNVINMSYKLTDSHINPSNLEKMRVSFVRLVFSSETAAAIQTMVACDRLSTKALPTAMFLELVEKWYKLINNRRPILAMLKSRCEENTKTMQFLNDFMLLLTQCD